MNNNKSKIPDQELLREFRLLNQELVIHYRMSDELLLCFIRARKHDLKRATKTLNNYVKMVKDYPDLFTALLPERVRHLLPHNQLLISPVRDKRNGCQTLIFCTGEFDTRICSMDDGFRCTLMALQRIIADVNTQLNGVYIIMDFNGFGFHQISQYSPSFMKKFSSLVQGSFPIRVKGIHVVNEPWIIKYLIAMISPFLSQKIHSRLFFHGQNFESLHRHIDPSCLPSNYNGELGSMKETMSFVQAFQIACVPHDGHDTRCATIPFSNRFTEFKYCTPTYLFVFRVQNLALYKRWRNGVFLFCSSQHSD